MEMPSLKHLSNETFQHVYEPAEDTFLLIDALEKDLDLIKCLRPDVCLEIGSGSGAVITSLAKSLKSSSLFLSTDINSHAALATKQTSLNNNTEVETVISDLAEVFESRLCKAVDLLIFNPPYVVTPSEEVSGKHIEASWAGGVRGREVMDRFFPTVCHLLSAKGLFYLVTVKENDPADIAHLMGSYGLEMTVVLSRRCGCEHLFVLRFSYQTYP